MGNVLQPFNYEVLPWIFGEHTYTDLKKLNEEFPLIHHDIRIGCSNEDFQHLDIRPCNESLWQLKEEIKGDILRASITVNEFIKKGLAVDMGLAELEGTLHDAVPNP
jgi:hypothetical protein